MEVYLTYLIPVLVGLIAAIPGVLAYRNQQISSKAEATSILVNTSLKQMDRMKAELDELQEEIALLNSQQQTIRVKLNKSEESFERCCRSLRRLSRECQALIHQLHSQRIEPVVDLKTIQAILNDNCSNQEDQEQN